MYRQMIKQGRGTYQLFNLQLKVFNYSWDGSYLVGGGIIASWGRCSCKPGNGVGCLGAMSYYIHWSTLASPMGSSVRARNIIQQNKSPAKVLCLISRYAIRTISSNIVAKVRNWPEIKIIVIKCLCSLSSFSSYRVTVSYKNMGT